jgi:CRISPR-associated protein Cmr6
MSAQAHLRAAVPRYVGTDLRSAPPGHRFGIYFAGFGNDWKVAKEKKEAGLRGVWEPMDLGILRLFEAVRDRQLSAASGPNGQGGGHSGNLIISAKTTGPFVTGMGKEHPLENGFAFLDPYGIPYLPGSSVKGVVRRAAEELVLFRNGEGGWDLLTLWWLFGFDGSATFFAPKEKEEVVREEQERWRNAYERACRRVDPDEARRFLETVGLGSLIPPAGEARDLLATLGTSGSQPWWRRAHLKGAVVFWDAFPIPPGEGEAFRIDVMTPHYGHYYQGGQPPGDWGNPIPVPYLTLPAGTAFTFVATLEPTGSLPQRVASQWKDLVTRAFEVAFDEVGFGANTSLGYGLMRSEPEAVEAKLKKLERLREEAREAEERRAREEARLREEERLRSLPLPDRLVEELKASSEERTHQIFQEMLRLEGDERLRVAEALKAAYQRLGRWSGKKLSKKQKSKVQRIRQILGEIE